MGDNPKRLEMARYLCLLIKEKYDWPNDHFIPNDPFDIVFQIPWDDLDIIEVIMRCEEDLEIEIKDEEAQEWGGALGDIVDFLVAKQS